MVVEFFDLMKKIWNNHATNISSYVRNLCNLVFWYIFFLGEFLVSDFKHKFGRHGILGKPIGQTNWDDPSDQDS